MRVGLGALGSSMVAAACASKVSATLVVDETRAPDHQRSELGKRPKPERGTDRTPPTVVRAEFAGSEGLRIYFSEAIAPLEGFDPADFRISVLSLYGDDYHRDSYDSYDSYGGYGGYDSYQPVAHYDDPGVINYEPPLRLLAAQGGGDRIVIKLSYEGISDFCHELESYDDNMSRGGRSGAALFLHYAAGSIRIRDVAGNALANFGADWVTVGRRDPPDSQLEVPITAERQLGADLVRIACGPEIPPGPR
jgi:hypothetical protein